MSLFTAEFVGTALLILLGNGVVANVLLNKSKGQNAGWMVITTGWAFAVMVGAYAVGRFSGAHINPAVSFAILIGGGITLSQFFVYVVAQMLGAMFGQLLVFITYKQHYDETDDAGLILATCSTGPAIRNTVWNFVTEVIGTFALVFGILMIGPHWTAVGGEFFAIFVVACLVWGIGLSLGGPTGYAINPARDLGPRIMHALFPLKHKGDSDWSYAWIPVVAPLCGAAIAAVVYQLVITL